MKIQKKRHKKRKNYKIKRKPQIFKRDPKIEIQIKEGHKRVRK